MSNLIVFPKCKPRADIGDVVDYRDQETKQLRRATVMDLPGERDSDDEWLTVADDGAPREDDASIRMSDVERIVPLDEHLGPAPDLLGRLTAEERWYLSIKLAEYRKEQVA